MTVWIARVNVVKSSYQETGIRNLGVFQNQNDATDVALSHIKSCYQKDHYEVHPYCTEHWEVR